LVAYFIVKIQTFYNVLQKHFFSDFVPRVERLDYPTTMVFCDM